jgi:hypothetical protein
VVVSHHLLTGICGQWPSFNDAEVVELNLWRGDVEPDKGKYVLPVLTAKIIVMQISRSSTAGPTDETGLELLPRARVTLRFNDVDELDLRDFNHCNQIVGLTFALQERGAHSDGSLLRPYVLVKFEPGFGMSASFRCLGVEITEAFPWAPDVAAMRAS